MALNFEKKEFIYDVVAADKPLLFIDANSQGIVELDSTLKRWSIEFPGTYKAFLGACMDGSAFIGETFKTNENDIEMLIALTTHARIGKYKDQLDDIVQVYQELIPELEKAYSDRIIISGHLSKYLGNGIMTLYSMIKNSKLNWNIYKE